MAKKKESAPTRSGLLDNICDAIRSTQKRETALSGTDISERYQLGIEIPLILQWLLTVNVLPFNHFIELHGPTDSAKSSLALQMCRWFIDRGGYAVYLESEDKFPVDIAKSLLTPEIYGDQSKFKFHTVRLASQFQDAILDYIRATLKANNDIREHNKKAAKKSSKLEIWPEYCCLIVVDSLAAGLANEIDKQINKKGFGERTVAALARAWSDPMGKLKNEVIGSNCTVIFINHERQQIGTTGVTTPGGSMIKYLKTIELRAAPSGVAGSSSGKYAEENSRIIDLQCRKNSGGDRWRKVAQLAFRWNMHREFWWEFDEAAVSMISDFLSEKKKNVLGRLESLSSDRKGWASKTLGVKDASAAEVLEKIVADEEIVSAFKGRFGICERPVFRST